VNAKQTVLLMTKEAQTENEIATVLEAEGAYSTNTTCANLDDIVAHLRQKHSPIALIDIDTKPDEILAQLESITSEFDKTRFIVLSGGMRNEWILGAMRAGARHYMVKESISAELCEVLHRLTPKESADQEPAGEVVTILSAGGGCGATTLAINMANSLRINTAQPCLLMDMDVSFGAVASCLGLKSQYGLADVLSQGERIDPQLILSTATDHREGLHILTSPATSDFGAASPLDFANTELAMEACRHAYPFTVVDAPRVPMDVAATLARQSLATFVVFQLNVKDLHAAQAIFLQLTERHVPWDTLIPVANRCQKRRMTISPKDAQQVLGSTMPIRQLSNDFASASQAMNYGQTLAKVAGRSKLCQDIDQLAKDVLQMQERRG